MLASQRRSQAPEVASGTPPSILFLYKLLGLVNRLVALGTHERRCIILACKILARVTFSEPGLFKLVNSPYGNTSWSLPQPLLKKWSEILPAKQSSIFLCYHCCSKASQLTYKEVKSWGVGSYNSLDFIWWTEGRIFFFFWVGNGLIWIVCYEEWFGDRRQHG